MALPATQQAFVSSLRDAHHECTLCYEEFTEEHPLVVLDNCRHVFGKECLKKWIISDNVQHNKCPTCRAVLFGEEDGQLQTPVQMQHAEPTPNPATITQRPSALTLEEINNRTTTIHGHFIAQIPNLSSFRRKLWRRVSRRLAPQYIALNKIVTPELDTAARIVMLDLLRHVGYVAMVHEYDYRYLLERSLGGDDTAMLLTRRLMQWVMCMIMLSPILPMEMEVVEGCFRLIPNYYQTLGFDVINSAVAGPSIANASMLQVLTMLFVDSNVEHICTDIGEQWYITAEPSDELFTVASRVKEKIDRMSIQKKALHRQLKVPGEEIVNLWQPDDEGAPQGIRDRLRKMLRGHEPPRVLTKPMRPRPQRDSDASPRVNIDLLHADFSERTAHDRHLHVQHRRDRTVNFTFFNYSSRWY